MSTTFGKMLLICNARAGRGRLVRTMPEIESLLAGRGLEYEVSYTERSGDATRLAREGLERGIKLLVAVGGDGTIHEVINGMLQDDEPVNPDAAIGVIAAGSGSDFIRTFGLPAMPRFAVGHLDGDMSFPIDVGKVSYVQAGENRFRYFANIAEAGLGAEVTAQAHRLPRWLGPTVYFFAFWLTLPRFRHPAVTVDLVDRAYEGSMNNLVVANGQFFGGAMKIAPKAAPTDGLLDVQIHHTSTMEQIALVPKIYKGEHVPHPEIDEFKRVRVSVTADRPLLIEADGEVLGHTPATFELLPEVLRLKV